MRASRAGRACIALAAAEDRRATVGAWATIRPLPPHTTAAAVSIGVAAGRTAARVTISAIATLTARAAAAAPRRRYRPADFRPGRSPGSVPGLSPGCRRDCRRHRTAGRPPPAFEPPCREPVPVPDLAAARPTTRRRLAHRCRCHWTNCPNPLRSPRHGCVRPRLRPVRLRYLPARLGR